MSWQNTLDLLAPGYDNTTCAELFITPIPDVAGIGVNLTVGFRS
jgi:hypothetical protein